jgi:hypothetical protein
MTTKPYAATVLKWLKDNGHRLGGLTGQDTKALRASVEIAHLWTYTDHPQLAAQAWGLVVRQMQEKEQQLAFHAVAHAADWGLRFTMWREAGMPGVMPSPCFRCKEEPPSLVQHVA